MTSKAASTTIRGLNRTKAGSWQQASIKTSYSPKAIKNTTQEEHIWPEWATGESIKMKNWNWTGLVVSVSLSKLMSTDLVRNIVTSALQVLISNRRQLPCLCFRESSRNRRFRENGQTSRLSSRGPAKLRCLGKLSMYSMRVVWLTSNSISTQKKSQATLLEHIRNNTHRHTAVHTDIVSSGPPPILGTNSHPRLVGTSVLAQSKSIGSGCIPR